MGERETDLARTDLARTALAEGDRQRGGRETDAAPPTRVSGAAPCAVFASYSTTIRIGAILAGSSPPLRAKLPNVVMVNETLAV